MSLSKSRNEIILVFSFQHDNRILLEEVQNLTEGVQQMTAEREQMAADLREMELRYSQHEALRQEFSQVLESWSE